MVRELMIGRREISVQATARVVPIRRIPVRCIMLLVWIGLVAGLLACERPSDATTSIHGVPAHLLSPEIRDLVAWQDSTLAAGVAAPAAADLRLYYRLRQDLMIPARRAAALDTLLVRWDQEPGHILWIDAALLRARLLDDPTPIFDRLTELTDRADDDPVAAFIETRSRWSRAGARERFLATDPGLGSSPSLSRLWLESRYALVEVVAGAPDLAVARLVRTMPLAWKVGGAALASCWWFEIAKSNIGRGWVDDALVAARQAEICAAASGDEILQIRCALSVGRAHVARAEFGSALVVSQKADRLATRGRHLRWMRSARELVANVALERGHPGEHLIARRRALALATALADTQAMVAATLGVAIAHESLADLDSSFVHVARAAELVSDDPTGALSVRVQAYRMSLLLAAGSFEAADSLNSVLMDRLPPQGRAAALTERVAHGLRTGRPDLVYHALAELRDDPAMMVRDGVYDLEVDLEILSARFHASQGELKCADERLAAARTRVEQQPAPLVMSRIRETEGLIAELAGDKEAAVSSYRRWLDLASEIGNPAIQNRAMVRLAEALLATERLDEARDLLRPAGQTRNYWARTSSAVLLGCVELAAGDPALALQEFAAAESMLGDNAPLNLLVRLRLERARAYVALDRIEDGWHELEPIDFGALDSGDQNAMTILDAFYQTQARDVAEIQLALLADHGARLGVSDPVGRSLDIAIRTLQHTPDDPGLDPATWRRAAAREISALRGVFFVGRERSFAWISAGDGWLQHELPPRDELDRAIGSVRTDMEDPTRTVAWATAHELTEALIGPAISHWPHDRPLLLMAPAILADLPWPALPLDPQARSQLVDRGPIIHLADLASARTPSEPQPTGSLLSVGVDAMTGDGPLRDAEREAREVAAIWPGGTANALVGDQATWRQVKLQAKPGVQVIHIATHAELSEGLPGHSTLRLAGAERSEPVTIPEVRSLDLDADLVFLSSCEGSRQVLDNKTGIGSFARAFLTAGAGAVIAASHRIDDQYALRLARLYYAEWQRLGRRADALRTAQMAVRNADDSSRHPYYWAFYQIFDRDRRTD